MLLKLNSLCDTPPACGLTLLDFDKSLLSEDLGMFLFEVTLDMTGRFAFLCRIRTDKSLDEF